MSYNLSIKELQVKIQASEKTVKDLTLKIRHLHFDIKQALVNTRLEKQPKLKSELQEYYKSNSHACVQIWNISDKLLKLSEQLQQEQKNLKDYQKTLSFKKFYA